MALYNVLFYYRRQRCSERNEWRWLQSVSSCRHRDTGQTYAVVSTRLPDVPQRKVMPTSTVTVLFDCPIQSPIISIDSCVRNQIKTFCRICFQGLKVMTRLPVRIQTVPWVLNTTNLPTHRPSSRSRVWIACTSQGNHCCAFTVRLL